MSEIAEVQVIEEQVAPAGCSATIGTPKIAARLALGRETYRRQMWYDSDTTWGYEELTSVSTWASELIGLLEMELGYAGFVFDRNNLAMTQRLLYWCWGIYSSSADSTTDKIPFPTVSKDNSNLQDDFNHYFYVVDNHYWARLEKFWRPCWMTDAHADYFFGALDLFCWRHIHTEESPAIQKERELHAAAYDDGSADEGRGGTEQGSYFKGKKEFY